MQGRYSLPLTPLADPTRREIMSRLAHKQATVGEVTQPFDFSAPAVSQHLKALERAHLHHAPERSGERCRYRPSP